MSKKNIQMQVLGESGYDEICPVPAEHASSHGKNGTDKISPVDIGAQSEIPITRKPDENVNIWIDPDEEDENYYYTKTETNTLLQKKADATKKTTITLSTNWNGDASPYTKTVTISGITANSKVDLQPDATAIAQMADDGTVALYIANDNGTLTAYAVGEKPTAEMTIQATITEVNT